MSDLRFDFKFRRFGFGNLKEKRAIRASSVVEERKVRRTKQFDKHRNLGTPSPIKEKRKKPADTRRERLLRWKKERDLRNKLAAEKAKPVFKVGIMHHKIYSPVFLKPKKTPELPPRREPPPKRITRATEKRLAAKAAEAVLTKMTTKHSKKPTQKTPVVAPKSFAPQGHQFKPPAALAKLPQMDMSSPANLRKSGTTNWFIYDAKKPESDENKEETGNARESEVVRFGRASVRKGRLKNLSNFFQLSTPANMRPEVEESEQKVNDASPRRLTKNRSVLMTTSNVNRTCQIIDEKEEVDEKESFSSKKVQILPVSKTPNLTKTPKLMKTPRLNGTPNLSKTPKMKDNPAKNGAVHYLTGEKTPKNTLGKRKIIIKRAKLC